MNNVTKLMSKDKQIKCREWMYAHKFPCGWTGKQAEEGDRCKYCKLKALCTEYYACVEGDSNPVPFNKWLETHLGGKASNTNHREETDE